MKPEIMTQLVIQNTWRIIWYVNKNGIFHTEHSWIGLYSGHVPRRTQHAGSRPFSVFLLSRGSAEQNKTQLSSAAPQHISTTERLTVQLTYTFVYIPPDADESVGQRAGATLVLRLRGDVVAEHPFHIETQHKVQETACLTILKEKEREVRQRLCGCEGMYCTYSYSSLPFSYATLWIQTFS